MEKNDYIYYMILKTPYDYAVKARKMGKKTISYSQISTYTNCPHHWKLEKIDKHSRFEPNMFLIFGTAFHETFQLYLDTMYKETAVAADRLDLNKILKENCSLLEKIIYSNNPEKIEELS